MYPSLNQNPTVFFPLSEFHLRVLVGKITRFPMILRKRNKLKVVVHQNMCQNCFDEVRCQESPGTFEVIKLVTLSNNLKYVSRTYHACFPYPKTWYPTVGIVMRSCLSALVASSLPSIAVDVST